MKRHLACALPGLLFLPLTLIEPARVWGQYLQIKPQNRVAVPGACMWSSVETVARTQGATAARGMAQQMIQITNGGARQIDVRRELDRRGVSYGYRPPGTYDWGTLKQAA